MFERAWLRCDKKMRLTAIKLGEMAISCGARALLEYLLLHHQWSSGDAGLMKGTGLIIGQTDNTRDGC
jgi:hypothetical protein